LARYFDGKEVELLAPAGTFEIFKRVVETGADAIYCGGKKLNMRIHRKDYNLTDDELRQAVEMSHSMGKKIYITLNNLYECKELKEVEAFLEFLGEIRPDAVLVQDFSVIEMVRRKKLGLNLHASVMMNAHNLETLKELQRLGITRVVASREMGLAQVKALHLQTGMEFEYFTHGDMCIAHGSQCLYSGILFGKSSNRGMCMKPCRWGFSVKKDGSVYPTGYPMAVKDMYMYENIPEMIQAGITSFKIEGRMRDADYIVHLVNCYSDAIDRYIDDPLAYDRRRHAEVLYQHRKRDFSIGYAFGKPGLSNINKRLEGTGAFYSTGQVFSKPVEEHEITPERIQRVREMLGTGLKNAQKPVLGVRVNSFEQATASLEEGADCIYLAGDVFEPDIPLGKKEILRLTSMKGKSKVFLALPRMTFEEDISRYRHLLSENLNVDGLLVTNLGAIHALKKFELEMGGDFSLNIYNPMAAAFYAAQGLTWITASLESPVRNTRELVQGSPIPVEMVVHGLPVVMYMEHDLYENTRAYPPAGQEANRHVDDRILVLKDDAGYEHPVFRDQAGRNHMTLYKELCLLPVLKELCSAGVSRFRIEARGYSTPSLRRILRVYKKAMADLDSSPELFMSMKSEGPGYTLGAFYFD
jgi:putative protease